MSLTSTAALRRAARGNGAAGADAATEPLTFRQPPHNLEAEQALLGAILVNNEALDRVSGFLTPLHFFDPLHGRIFETLATLIHAGKTVTPVTVKTFFENAEPINVAGEQITVAQYLARLAANAPAGSHASEYGRTVYDLAARRSLIIIGEELTKSAFDAGAEMSPTEILAQHTARLVEVQSTMDAVTATSIEFSDDLEDAKPARDLLEGTIPKCGVGMGYGESTAGKTFWGIGLGFAIARGETFMGRATDRAPVLFVPLEGAGGIKARLLAARQEYGLTGKNFARMIEPVVMGRMPGSERCVAQITTAAKHLEEAAGAPVGLIFIDTWHQAIAGDNDNDSGTAGAVFAQARAITKATGATVLFLDHPGKDGVLRGSSAKKPGCDFLIKFARDKSSGITEVIAEKVKDGEEGPRGAFRLEQIDLAHGKTSCVVVSTTESARRTPKRPAPESQTGKALNELEHLVIGGKTTCLPHHDRIPANAKLVSKSVWRDACREKQLSADGGTEAERKAFNRGHLAMSQAGLIGSYGDWVWLLADIENAD